MLGVLGIALVHHLAMLGLFGRGLDLWVGRWQWEQISKVYAAPAASNSLYMGYSFRSAVLSEPQRMNPYRLAPAAPD